MKELQHNVVSILYSLRGMIETHLASVEEGRYGEPAETLARAEAVLKRARTQTDKALLITRRIGGLMDPVGDCYGSPCAGIERVWRDTLSYLNREFVLSRFEIIERIPARFPDIACSPEALKEIFYHIAKNALQAMGREGKLVIRAQVSFSVREEAYAVIHIADTGPGIPEERLSCLFRPFFTTKREKEGSGLGLYLAKALANKYHGKISVSSFAGAGTTFSLEFPVARLAQSAD